MNKVLALRYRPIKFTDVVGQGHVKIVLRSMVTSGNVPPALIFGGSRGTGKTSTARIFAAALNCEDSAEGDACGECPSCLSVQQGHSTSVLEVDAASNGGVEEVRKLRDICSYAHSGQWRVVLLDEAQSLTKEAFNALLKLLEEPPPYTTFILLTTETHKILDTVRSRSMRFEFRRIADTDIRKRLRDISNSEDLNVSDDLLTEIARRSQGGMRDAVMMLDQASRVGVSTVTDFHEMFGISNVAEPLMRAAVDGDFATGARIIEEAFARVGDATGMTSDLIFLARDIITLKAGAPLWEYSADDLTARKELADRVPGARLAAAVKVLWNLKSRTRHTEDDQLAVMHMAFVLLTDALQPKVAEKHATPAARVTSPEPEAARRMTLEEIRAQLGQTKVSMPIS